MPVLFFTDIEGSTELWEQYTAAMGEALSRYEAIHYQLIAVHGGRIVKRAGDKIIALFQEGQPLACALALQEQIADEEWGALGNLRIRIALHAVAAEQRSDDICEPVTDRAARLLTAGWGGQILLTQEAVAAAALPPGAILHDLGTHVLTDLSEPQHVFMLTRAESTAQEFPPLRSLSGWLHNLPAQQTPFLGREAELAEIGRLLHGSESRLISIVGPGGVGKTRAALQAAADQIEHFPSGVYFVPLAPLSQPDFLASTIAEALRCSFDGHEELSSQLLNFLREKRLLLVLDNFEHLIPAADFVAEMLGAAPGVTILVTSRERLNLDREQIVELQGMSIPPSPHVDIPEDYAAVQLFLQAARRVHPSFAPEPDDLAAVIRICRLAQGLPLGVELAAAWVRLRSCRQIAQEIEQRIDPMSSTVRELPEHEQSLRGVFDYSWQSLSPEERRVLRMLAVFRGGFSDQAAAQVADAPLPLLNSLVEKSLVRRESDGRYQIHEVLRQYAEERLAEVPQEQGAAQERHCRYYATLLQKREAALTGERKKEALGEIGAEIENVRAAWRWAAEQKDGGALQNLNRFYDTQG